jgi:hypothetical protein
VDGEGRILVIATLCEVSVEGESKWSELADLVVRAQQGDRAAFGELVEQFERTVHAICLRRLGNPSEALELTQEVFLHVMKRLDQLREPERFVGWLKRIAVRKKGMEALQAVLIVVVGFFWAAFNKPKLVPGKLQMVAEAGYDFIRRGVVHETIGKREGEKYVPLMVSLFFFIWIMNIWSVIPLAQFPVSSVIA